MNIEYLLSEPKFTRNKPYNAPDILGLYTEKLWSFSVKVPEMFRKNAGKVF